MKINEFVSLDVDCILRSVTMTKKKRSCIRARLVSNECFHPVHLSSTQKADVNLKMNMHQTLALTIAFVINDN